MLVSISAALSTQIQELVVLLDRLVVLQNVEVGDEDGEHIGAAVEHFRVRHLNVQRCLPQKARGGRHQVLGVRIRPQRPSMLQSMIL